MDLVGVGTFALSRRQSHDVYDDECREEMECNGVGSFGLERGTIDMNE